MDSKGNPISTGDVCRFTYVDRDYKGVIIYNRFTFRYELDIQERDASGKNTLIPLQEVSKELELLFSICKSNNRKDVEYNTWSKVYCKHLQYWKTFLEGID